VAAVGSVAVVVESAIAGKRITLIERRKGAKFSWHSFFVYFRGYEESPECHLHSDEEREERHLILEVLQSQISQMRRL
jgi:hypothetical protein